MPKRKTDAEFKKEVYDLVGDEYVFLEPYQGALINIKVKHNKCGNVYEVRPSNFINAGERCPKCFGSHKRTNTQFKKEIFDLVGDEYTFLDSYVNTHTKLRVKHNKCGNTYEVRPIAFIKHNTRCPFCYGNPKKTDAKFRQEVYDLVGDEYVFLEPYVNNYTKIKVKHNKCGNTYVVKPTHFIDDGTRCPFCHMPKSEEYIAKILDTFNIKYEIQKTFDDLRDAQPLSYDFYIPDQNILIEYQGRQHYQPVDLYGGEDLLEYQQKHDKLKSDYAKGNGYNLIAVPYTEDTLSKIKKYLVKHGLEQHLKNTSKRDAAFYFNFAQS